MLLKRTLSISRVFTMCFHDKYSTSAKYISLTYCLQFTTCNCPHQTSSIGEAGSLETTAKEHWQVPQYSQGWWTWTNTLATKHFYLEERTRKVQRSQISLIPKVKNLLCPDFLCPNTKYTLCICSQSKTLYLFQYPGKPLNHSVSVSQERRRRGGYSDRYNRVSRQF